MLTAAMQEAFLGGETMQAVLGLDFSKAEDRAAYIRRLVDLLFTGGGQPHE